MLNYAATVHGLEEWLRRTTPRLVLDGMVAWGTQSCDFWNDGVAMSTGYGPLCHESLMTAKDVKSLARKYNVSLDLHPCAPTEG
ncbi:hypothetical protein Tco_0985544 [Tanacetum coccineum]